MKSLSVSLLLFLLFSLLTNAEEIKVDITSTVSIIDLGGREVKSFDAEVYLLPPTDHHQTLLDTTLTPNGKMFPAYVFFSWNTILDKSVAYNVSYRVQTNADYFPVTKHVSFPLLSIPIGYERYLGATEYINSNNPEVTRLAKSLAKDNNDLYDVVFTLANFTHHYIQYDVNQAGQRRSAEWILKNKGGVCGDFTSLFLALTRSLDIPSKYVTGIAGNEDGFIPHAWAEVYMPEFGFVPFDPTYGQYGYLDQTHVKLAEERVDSSVKYTWSGKNFNVTSSAISITAQSVASQAIQSEKLDVTLNLSQSNVGIGSYVGVSAAIQNKGNYYRSSSFHLFGPKELSIISSLEQSILLPPFGNRTLHWLVKVSGELPREYHYTFPLVVTNQENYSTQLEVDASNKVYYNVDVKAHTQCQLSSDIYYEGDGVEILCTVDEPFEFCIDKNCEVVSNGSQKLNASSLQGNHHLTFTSKNLHEKMEYTVVDAPFIKIEALAVPKEIQYGEQGSFMILLTKQSESMPENIRLQFGKRQVRFSDLSTPKKVEFPLVTTMEKFPLVVKVEYYNSNGGWYEQAITLPIVVTDASLWQKFVYFLKNLRPS